MHKSKKSLTRWLKVSAGAILLLLGINALMTIGVVASYKDTFVKDAGTLSDGNGHVVKSAPAMVSLSLSTAPVMDDARIVAINELSVTIPDGPDGTMTKHFLKVQKVQVFNDTAAIFSVANNEAVHVWNGDAFFVTANGTAYRVCEATATCAALYVDDKDEKEQLEEKANAALVAGGFIEAAERRRLRFQPQYGKNSKGEDAFLGYKYVKGFSGGCGLLM